MILRFNRFQANPLTIFKIRNSLNPNFYLICDSLKFQSLSSNLIKEKRPKLCQGKLFQTKDIQNNESHKEKHFQGKFCHICLLC